MLKGMAVSAGVGIGQIVVVQGRDPVCPPRVFAGAEAELERLEEAMVRLEAGTRAMARGLEEGGREARILLSQLTVLRDPALTAGLHAAIRGGLWAERGVEEELGRWIALFDALEDPMMAQRGADLRDLRRRLLLALLGQEDVDLSRLPPNAVVAAHDLTPSMTVGLDPSRVAAVLTEVGGMTSHTAILARAMGLPAVVGIPGLLAALTPGETAVVDGERGEVLLSPDPETLARYESRRGELSGQAGLTGPVQMADGTPIRLLGNISSPQEAAWVTRMGGAGVGLFRTEFLFMGPSHLPDEEEQYRAYREASRLLEGGELVIRTLDVGGDKDAPCLSLPREDNPCLGVRGVRLSLAREELLTTQLRAILRASAHGRMKILLPMITGVEEVERCRSVLDGVMEELEGEGIPFDRHIPLGVMIETPAALLTADLLARRADFFSVGTNDLTQYLMAADRGNGALARLGVPWQPAVLRAICHVLRVGREAGIPVAMCGEAAAHPQMIPLLLGWGLEEFSVAPPLIPAAAEEIARWTGEESRALCRQVMALSTPDEVWEHLNRVGKRGF